jgi:hypothetical protein
MMDIPMPSRVCCDNGTFDQAHTCQKSTSIAVNGAGIPLTKLSNPGRGRPKGTSYLHAKHASSIAKRFKAAGLDWATDFALAIKANKRERIKLWLRLLPYLITTTNKVCVKKWKGRASKAALIALDTLEGR